MTALAERAAAGTQPKLSEICKHLVIPTGIVDSYWPEIHETCTNRLGIEFDEWQNGLNGLALAHRADGSLAHTVSGVGMSIPRQVGKTYSISGLLFGLCVDHSDLLVIWSAHHGKTHMETFLAMQSFCKRAKVDPFIDKVYTGSGDEEVRFINGSRILFGARERGFGRGIAGVDVLMSDEAQILSERAMANMLATLNVSRLGLHIYAGTPPKPEDNSENFIRMRQEALSGEATDLVWVEMGADDDADLNDVDQWHKANPSIGFRTPIASIQRLRKRLSDDDFKREALGIWDESDISVFDIARWAELTDTSIEPPYRAALVVDVSPDRRHATIGMAGEVDGRTLVMVHPLSNVGKVVKLVEKLLEEKDIIDVSITSGAARALEPDLTQAGIEFSKLSQADTGAAYAALQEAIKAGTVVHVGQPELDDAMLMARTRFMATGEAETFDRRGYSVDLSPAVSVACALYQWGLCEKPMPVIM